MRLALFEPEIPPNTGNIARLCAATKTELHLIEPLGFTIDNKHLKRAGLDYWPHVPLSLHKNWEKFCTAESGRLVLSSAKHGIPWCEFTYTADDILVLGPETRGLPEHILKQSVHHVRIPIYKTVRSLNLSTAAGILLMEALRQTKQLAA